jgi:hypothetical protein
VIVNAVVGGPAVVLSVRVAAAAADAKAREKRTIMLHPIQNLTAFIAYSPIL